VKALGIDFGGTHATCGLVEDRVLLAHETIDTDCAKSLQAFLPRIRDACREIMRAKGLSSRDVAGVAIGFAALVDSRVNRVVSTDGKYEDVKDIDLAEWIRENVGLPTRIENDARMALLGESYAGAARDFTDVVMMTLGTGIGGAAMIEGKLLRGKHAQAGCLGGHIPAVFNGRPCACGAIGCAEAEASGWSLPLIIKDWPGATDSALSRYLNVGFKELFEEAARGDKVAVSIRDRCLNVWAADAVGLVHAYDPEMIVIGGGVMKSADVIIPHIQSYVHKYAWTPWGKVQVRAAELGSNSVLMGAVPLLSQTSQPMNKD
jgi:glucokinase